MKYTYHILSAVVILLVAAGVYSNLQQQKAQDRSKLPPKVEESRGFQRWITNLKNKDLLIEADDFKMVEEVEVYNTKWMKVYSMDEPGQKEKFEEYITMHQNIDKVIFSPSEREFLDFRNIERDNYKSNEVQFYGQKEDKIIDLRALDCSLNGNCFFDRAYFLSNDLFVITEVSRNIDKKATYVPPCTPDETCTYTFKLHLVDLINNSRLVYESNPFEAVLSQLLPNL